MVLKQTEGPIGVGITSHIIPANLESLVTHVYTYIARMFTVLIILLRTIHIFETRQRTYSIVPNIACKAKGPERLWVSPRSLHSVSSKPLTCKDYRIGFRYLFRILCKEPQKEPRDRAPRAPKQSMWQGHAYDKDPPI